MHIAEDHPAMPGHFPGYPLVPAVLIMDRVIESFEKKFNINLGVFSFPEIKFLVPMFPKDEFEINFTEVKPGRIQFTLSNDKFIYTKGKLSYDI